MIYIPKEIITVYFITSYHKVEMNARKSMNIKHLLCLVIMYFLNILPLIKIKNQTRINLRKEKKRKKWQTNERDKMKK